MAGTSRLHARVESCALFQDRLSKLVVAEGRQAPEQVRRMRRRRLAVGGVASTVVEKKRED